MGHRQSILPLKHLTPTGSHRRDLRSKDHHQLWNASSQIELKRSSWNESKSLHIETNLWSEIIQPTNDSRLDDKCGTIRDIPRFDVALSRLYNAAEEGSCLKLVFVRICFVLWCIKFAFSGLQWSLNCWSSAISASPGLRWGGAASVRRYYAGSCCVWCNSGRHWSIRWQ